MALASRLGIAPSGSVAQVVLGFLLNLNTNKLTTCAGIGRQSIQSLVQKSHTGTYNMAFTKLILVLVASVVSSSALVIQKRATCSSYSELL